MQAASLSSERSSDGSQTYIRIDGVINERFDGKQAAARIKSKNVVVNCAGLSMITSYGVRAWLEFVRSLERRKLDLYFVECSTAFVRELNQVLAFAGPGQVVSCYLPYSCSQCRAQRSVLLRVDLDKSVVKDREPDEYSCLVCGSAMEFDDEPGLFFPALENHVGQNVEPGVLEFLKARLSYESDSQTHLKVLKDVSDNTTVVSFAGTLDGTLNGAHLAQGLQGEIALDLNNIIHVQQQGLRAWREFIQAARPHDARLWLFGCPTLIVEKGLEPVPGLHLVSVRIPYYCYSCEQTEFVLVELASKEGKALAQGQLRDRACSSCKKATKPMVSTNVIGMLSQLPTTPPPRSVPKAVAKTSKRLAKARVAQLASQNQGQRMPRWVPVLAVIAVVGAAGAVAAGAIVLRQSQTAAVPQNLQGGNQTNVGAPADRPDWIISDSPSSSYCVDLGGQLRCVGVSSYHANLDHAEKEGFEGAIEVFVHSALLNSRSTALETQRSIYLKARSDATSTLERAAQAKDLMAAREARNVIRSARARVAGAITKLSPPGAPTQRSDHYWEEYDAKNGATEFLAFVRIDVSNAEVLAFSKYFTSTFKAGPARLTRLNPSLAWILPEDTEAVGLFATKIGDGELGKAGMKTGDMIVTDPNVVTSPEPGTELLNKLRAKEKVTIRRGETLSEPLEVTVKD